MGLNSTPSANRVHIGFFGRRNAGKSSVVNAVTGQELAVVSDTKGTTTDPVYKSMELLPIGPVMIIDTPGFVMGGAYEYICSAVGELLFGVIFWDYSGFKFNLGGRVNLLYCFFWGIAAVVWIRYGYPLVAKLMANLKKHILPWMTVVLTVFMAVNMGLSALALARYDARTSGLAPANQLDVFLDEHFDNARMERVYPNAKKTG